VRAGFGLSRSSWLAGLTATALAGTLAVAVAPPAVAGSNASLELKKTVTGATVTPTLAATLGVDKASAIPGDQLTYTARVTNTGAVLTLTGSYSAAEVPDNAGTLADWYDEVEYHDLATKSWVSLGGYQATQSGWTPASPSPASTGLAVTTTPAAVSGVSYPSGGDHVLGTAIGAGKTASWSYTAKLTLSAAQVAVLADSKRSDEIRNVVHVEVTPRDPKSGQPYIYRTDFTDPISAASTPITAVSVAFTLPDGSTRTVGPASVPALASIPVGGSVDVPTNYTVPTVAPPGANEADAAYLSRLGAVEGSPLTAKATATGTGAGSTLSAGTDPVSSTEHLPIVSVGKSGPATVDAGDTGTYQLPVQNTGGAAAGQIALTDTVPAGGAGTVTGAPSSLAPGGSVTATASFPVPDNQPDGPLTDTAQVRWADANGNPYGPVSASFTTTVQSSLVGAALTLAPETAGPDVVGTQQVLTATLVDRNGLPVPNIAVTLTVSGTNSVTGTVSTNSAGVASFHYTGAAAGLDTAQAKAVAGTVQVESNTAQIGWVSPIAPIGTTSVDGRFFTESASATTFVAKPGDTPTFGQSFPNLAFNPSAAALPHNLTGITPSSHPFTDVTTDLMGNGIGTIVAQGNGKQAGAGTMTSFDAVFTANFVVAKPGDVTFRFDYDAGFLFGIGGGASRVNGSYENPPASNVSPFEGYPLVGADNRPNNAVHTTTVTVHFPAAGSYPYEVDYTESGGPTLSLVLSTVSFTADTSGITAYVGYADGLRPGGSVFPFPWNGSPNTLFVGCQGSCQFDGGAVRLDNTTGQPVTINSLTVDFGPNCRFAIWPHDRVLPDGQTAIFTQTISGASSGCPADGSFDTSDAPFITCSPTHIIPHITFTVDGQTHSFDDSNQVLNTKGVDLADCPGGNESQPWSRIGGDGVGINTPLPPAGSVLLSPLSGGDAKITSVQADAGTAQGFRVDVLDASGLPVGNAPVDMIITGGHPGHVLGTTGADGTTVLSYNASSAGDDSVQVSTFISGMRTQSGIVSVHWSLPPGTVPDPVNPGQTLPAPPPVISAPTPADGTRVTAPLPVQATITPPDGETITSWQVSYQAVSPGSPQLTLASGTGTPPATLATLDPSVLANDTYTLIVSATSSGGGLQTSSSTVTVDGGLKPGRYQTSYTDVDLPVNGLPMQVIRSYDSFDPRLGDFGVGWQVSVGNFRISANRTLGAGGWTEYPIQCSFFGCQYAFKSSVPHTVTVTFPDQHQERFNFTPSGGFSVFYFLGSAAFTPVPGTGTTSTLEPLSTEISYDFAGNIDNDLFGDLYSPTRFKLTTRDGKVFILDTGTGLVSETDPSGNSVTVDGSGVHASTGQSITFVKDVTGRITKITQPDGQEIHYGYSPGGDLTSVQYPGGVTASYTYDQHRLVSSAGGGKPTSTVQYDASGRAVAITDGAGNHTVLDNDVAGRQQVVHDRNGLLTTVYTYDDLGDVLQKEQIVGGSDRITKFGYDSLGRVTDLIDPQLHHQRWVYDETDTAGNGNLLSYTDANDRTTRYTGYDAHGHASTVIGPDNVPIGTFNYDPATGLLLSSQRPGSPPSVFSYYPNGRLKTSVDPAGRTVNYTYNSAGYRTTMSDAAGHTTGYLPDANGRYTAVTDPSHNTTHYSYDGMGNVASVTDPSGGTQTYHYNDRGQLDQAGDGSGTTSYAYNDAGRVAQRTDRNGAVTSYEYDVTGKLTKESRPGNDVTSYRYDPLERLVEADNADSELTFSYDEAGNVARQVSCAPQPAHADCTAGTDAGQQPTVQFDYGWAEDGQQASVSGPAGTTHYHYDGNGRLAEVLDPAGHSASYHFDAQSKLSSVDSPNGVLDSFSYDPSSLLTGRDASSGATTIAQSDYTIDPATAQRSSATDLDGTSTFSYQDNGWLTRATHPAGSGLGEEDYSYDGAGNVTSTAGVPAAQVGYTAGRLTQFGTATLVYDAEGNLASKTDTATSAVTRYHWNTDHELTSVDLPDGSAVRYSYDPLHRRVQAVAGSTVTRYAWDAFNLAAVYDGNNHLVSSYVTLPTGADANDVAAPAEALERIDAGGTAYFVHDGSDSTTALTDATGAVTSRYRYGTAGLPASGNGPETGYTWIGAQYDAATGLYYLNDRYYDPATGRFISEDPASAQYYNAALGRWTHSSPAPAVGHPVSFNRYAYAGNDPVDASDPSGDGIRAVLATAACAITLLSGSGVAEGTAFQEPLEKIVECIEQYVDDKKEREEAIELAEELAEADEEPVAELIIDDIGEEIVEIYEISIEITIVEEL
jgi:RHS repeat-associated protein/uncharacterized repeat protein (TIGR01451 family)